MIVRATMQMTRYVWVLVEQSVLFFLFLNKIPLKCANPVRSAHAAHGRHHGDFGSLQKTKACLMESLSNILRNKNHLSSFFSPKKDTCSMLRPHMHTTGYCRPSMLMTPVSDPTSSIVLTYSQNIVFDAKALSWLVDSKRCKATFW